MANQDQNSLWRSRRLPALGILLVALAFRVAVINRDPLWFDELWSWQEITHGLSGIFAIQHRDLDPPLYYLILYGWRNVFGDTEVALRSFSVLCSMAMIAEVIFLFPRLVGSAAALIAGLALALLPLDILHAHEARMYPMAELLEVTSVFSLYQLVQLRSWMWGIAYFAVSLALAYTHYVGALVLFAQGIIILLGAIRGDLDIKMMGVVLAMEFLIALLLAPWVWFFLVKGAEMHAEASHMGWIASLRETAYNVIKALGGFAAPVVALVMILGLAAGRKDKRFLKICAALFLLTAVPLLILAIVSITGGPLMRPHTTAMVLPWVALLTGATAWRVASGRMRLAATGLVAASLLGSAAWSETRQPYSNYRVIFATLHAKDVKILLAYPNDLNLAGPYYGGGMEVHNINSSVPGVAMDLSPIPCGSMVALGLLGSAEGALLEADNRLPLQQYADAHYPSGWSQMKQEGQAVFYSDNTAKPGKIEDHKIFYLRAPKCR